MSKDSREGHKHNPPGRLLNVHLGSGVIRVTGNHPFFAVNRGWTRADRLNVGDLLLSHTGTPTPVTDIFDKYRKRQGL